MPMAVRPEAAPLERAMLASTAEEYSAVELGYPLNNRSEEAMDIAFLVPASQCSSP
jgi:hypothetical protein